MFVYCDLDYCERSRGSCDLDCSFDLDCYLGSALPWVRRADNDDDGGGQIGIIERLWESDGFGCM